MQLERVLAAAALATCLGMACEREAERSFVCEVPDKVEELSDIHYEGADCDAAIRSAESRLTTAYYRKACEQLAPSEGLPDGVSDAFVSHCQPAPGDEGGSILKVRICCP